MDPLPIEQTDPDLAGLILRAVDQAVALRKQVEADRDMIRKVLDQVERTGQAYWADRIRKARTLDSQLELCKRVQLKEGA